jgi:hypothetical protein
MDTWTMIAVSAFGMSTLVSVLQIGNWALRADPRALANAGRWTVLALSGAAAAALAWLTINGRWTSAMMLAAFVMPVIVRSAPRWRGLLGTLRRRNWARVHLDTSGVSASRRRSPRRDRPDPELVGQSIAVLQSYLDQVSLHHHQALTFDRLPINGSGRRQMSREEAFEVLGLEPTASLREIREACSRLEQKFDPGVGGTHYLAAKINEAKDVLFEDWGVLKNVDQQQPSPEL